MKSSSFCHFSISACLSIAFISFFCASIFQANKIEATHSDHLNFNLAHYYVEKIEAGSAQGNHCKAVFEQFKLLEQVFPQQLWPEALWHQLQATTQQLFSYHTTLLKNGEEYFHATLYSEAIPCYQELLESLDKGDFPQSHESAIEIREQVLCRLAQSYFYLDEFNEAAHYFSLPRPSHHELPSHLQALDQQTTYLYALTSRHLKRYEEALALLGKLQKDLSLTIQNEIQFELALNHFLLGNIEKAKAQLIAFEHKVAKPHIAHLVQLYLSRINMAEGEFSAAAVRLKALEGKILKENFLYFELAYLQGEAAFHLKKYAEAVAYFDRACPNRHLEHAEWYTETLYHLGWSYLKMADASNPEHFDKAEDYFEKLLVISPDERVFLALAQNHLARGAALQDPKSYQAADVILSKEENFHTLDAKTHALLLRAEAAASYEERNLLYAKLTDPANSGSLYYAKGWYLRGLNDYEQALAIHSDPLMASAVNVLAKATSLMQKEDPSCAALAFKYAILGNHHLETKESLMAACALIDEGLTENKSFLAILKESQELYYLYAWGSFSLAEKLKEYGFQDKGAAYLLLGLEEFPEGQYAPDSLNLLGAYYLRQGELKKAKETFLLLSEKFPRSKLAGDALYWCAVCAEKAGEERSVVQNYQKKIYEAYPESIYAPDAYFHIFSYQDYLQGDRAAVKHLEAFSQKFSDTHLLIKAYYLLGLDWKRERKTAEGKSLRKKNLVHAINAFFEAENHFDTLYVQNKIPKEQMEHYVTIRYRALLERALANQAIAEKSQDTKQAIYFQYSQELFLQINKELADAQHPLAKYLAKEGAFPKIQEESLYLTVKNHQAMKNDQAAEAIIQEFIAKSLAAEVFSSYYLSRIYYEQGTIALRGGDDERALVSFANAEESNQGDWLSVDQKLDLWIQQSMCYKALNQLDNAMLILSKVINDPAVSNLRIKAMLLRADIYNLQGRHELARKQLEATAKKGGEWAVEAKIKLDQDYGYQ